MRFGKIISAVFLIAFAVSFVEVRAQNSNLPKQIKILNNSGSIPFEDGKTIIAEVRFAGLDSDYEEYDKTVGIIIPESDFRRMWRRRQAVINVDDKFDGSKVSKVVKLLREWLVENGYADAQINALGEKLPKNRMNLVFKIERGALAHVSEIRFVGNVNLTEGELIENFKQCSGDGWEIFDTRKYEYYSQICSRKILHSKGYFEAKIKRVTPQIVDGNRIVTIAIDEGVRYRMGEIKIEGAKVFTRKEILEMWGQSEGDVADGKLLQEFLYDKLKRIYADKGYIFYAAEFDPELIKPIAEGLDATVNLSITIDEGKAFKISRIRFLGVEKEKERQLVENFSLKQGDVFNQSEFEKGIKKIEDTKEFYSIDIDKEVDMRTNEETAEVVVIVNLYPPK